MSRNRFYIYMIHFFNNENLKQIGDITDRLRKIRYLLNMLIEHFQYVMVPPEEVCIDEILVPKRLT